MNENADIFIFAQRDFEKCPTNSVYKVVSTDAIEGLPIENVVCGYLPMEHSYSEGARIKYLLENYELKDYIGTAHYRRYFEFFDDVPDMDAVFAEHDAILPKFSLGGQSVIYNYKSCHYIDDLWECLDIIDKLFPDYYATAEDVLSGCDLIPCNIFVLRKEDFIEWGKFVFGVLDEFDARRGFKTDLDVYNYVANRIPQYCDGRGGKSGTTQYQSRIQAFLMERLSTIFFKKNIKNPLVLSMILTEGTDGFIKNYANYEK